MGPRDGRTVKEDALASFPVKSRQGKAGQAAAAQALHRHAVTHPCQQIFGQQLDASVTFPERNSQTISIRTKMRQERLANKR